MGEGEQQEREDPVAAECYAAQVARKIAPGCEHRLGCGCDPPHWVRCNWMKQGERCRLGSGHGGPHKYRVVAE
jgi:hypothetical protein